MNSFIKNTVTAILIGLVGLSPFVSFAQTNGNPPLSSTTPSINLYGSTDIPKPDGLTSCDDYYRFGSTPVTLEGNLTEVGAGSDLAFTGTVENQNPYPISDASVWIKVLRSRGTEKDSDGPDVVDFFKVAYNLTLPANASTPISGTWHVPADAENGDYQLATFVVQDDRFNFEGLTFTDDVVGQGYNFTVVSGSTGSVGFAKNMVNAAGYPFSFDEFPPIIQAGVPTNVSDVITNNLPVAYKGNVTWQLYSWDSIESSHLITQSTVPVKLQPNSSTTLSYTISDTSHSVYYVVGTLATNGGSKSIIGVRLARTGVNIPRLSFVGVVPAASGKGVAVACIHSSGLAPAASSTVDLSVYRTGIFGSVLNLFLPLASTQYKGPIPTTIYALTVPTDASQSEAVEAKLYQNGALVDQVTIPYCTTKDGQCSVVSSAWWIVGIVVIVLILIFLAIRKRKIKAPQFPQT
jgi:hypothetical protein